MLSDFFGQECKIGAMVYLLKNHKGFSLHKKIIPIDNIEKNDLYRSFFLNEITNILPSKNVVVYEIKDKKGKLVDVVVSPYLWFNSVIEDKLDCFV